MRRLFVMALLTLALAVLLSNGAPAQAQGQASYVCEFAGIAEVEDGALVELQVTKLVCE